MMFHNHDPTMTVNDIDDTAAAGAAAEDTSAAMIDFATDLWPDSESPQSARRETQQTRTNNTTNTDETCSLAGSTAPDPDVVDTMMAKEFGNLTFQERNDIYEEIHGVSTMATTETPQLIQEALRRLAEELDGKSGGGDCGHSGSSDYTTTATTPTTSSATEDKTKHAYTIAIAYATVTASSHQHPTTHQHCTRGNSSSLKESFKLRFLRCELFDPVLAAKRICACFDLIYKVYGMTGLQNFVWIECINYNYNHNGHNGHNSHSNHNGSSSSSSSRNNNTNSANSYTTQQQQQHRSIPSSSIHTTKPTAGQQAASAVTNNSNNSNDATINSWNNTDAAACGTAARTTPPTQQQRRSSPPPLLPPLGFKTTLLELFLDTKADLKALTAGYIQTLPFRDRSGRKIIVLVLDALKLQGSSRFKIWLYTVYVATEDCETQRNGVVLIFWPGMMTTAMIPHSKHQSYVRKSFESIPVRFPSLHLCFPNTKFFNILRSVLTLVLKPPRTRVKVHSGESMIMRYELMTYGIPISLIPTTETGRLKTKNIVQWIKTRKLIDVLNVTHNNNSMSDTPPTPTTATKTNTDDRDIRVMMDEQQEREQQRVECPGVSDVIFRSAGKSCLNNPGNIAFRGIFEKYHERHVHANQTDKKNMIWLIVEEVEKKQGRFLNWDKKSGWWIPMTDRNEIRSKVAISLRDYNKQCRAVATTNQQKVKSSTYAFIRQDGSNKRRKRTSSSNTIGGPSSSSSPFSGTNNHNNSPRGGGDNSLALHHRLMVTSDSSSGDEYVESTINNNKRFDECNLDFSNCGFVLDELAS